jgi:hypothetical protein
MAWKGSKRKCSPERKENCLFFVNDMLNWLITEPGKGAQPPNLMLYVCGLGAFRANYSTPIPP